MFESKYFKSETIPAFDTTVSAALASYGIEGGGREMRIAVENFDGKIYRVVASFGMGAYMHAVSSLLELGMKDVLADSINGKDGYDSWFVATPEMHSDFLHKIAHGKVASYKAKLPAMRDWLIEVARHKEPVEYGQVMKAFGIDRFSLRHAMDFLGHQADDLNEPIITALIIGKKSRKCSSGLAKEFGVLDDDAERQRLYDFWSSNPQ